MDSIETLIRWKQDNNVQPNQEESIYIKRIIKELASTFPNEWDEALEEMERSKAPIIDNNPLSKFRFCDEKNP